MAAFIGIAFFLASRWLVSNWIQSDMLSPTTIQRAVIVFGLSLALRWPAGIYVGVLLGLERQVLFNVARGILATFRILGGAAAVVWAPNILVFLWWQVVASLASWVVMATVAWRALQGGGNRRRAVFDAGVIRGIWRFSATLTLSTMAAAVLRQADRVLLSGMVSLSSLGYYSVASSGYGGLETIPTPITQASFPLFASLIARKRTADLARMYHKATQYVSFLAAPAAGFVCFFAGPLLQAWTRSEAVAANAAPILSVLALAFAVRTLLNCRCGCWWHTGSSG
jgi:O-antigen/teichoic acid export membrane protein